MAACSGDFEGTLRLRLPFYFREIRIVRRDDDRSRRRPRQELPAGQMSADLEERPRLINAGFPDQGRFVGTCGRQDECTTFARRAPGHREGPAHRTQLARQRELPGEFVFREPVALELVRGGEDAE